MKFLTCSAIILFLITLCLPQTAMAVQRRGARAIITAKSDSLKDTISAKRPGVVTKGAVLIDTAGGAKKYWLGNFGVADHEVYDRTGYVDIGLNLFLKSKPLWSDGSSPKQLSNAGLYLGFNLPVRVPIVACMYRVRLFLHDAVDTTNKKAPMFYACANNEILIGKTILFRNATFEPMPYFSIGFNNGIAVNSEQGWHGGQTHYFTSWGLGIILRKRFTLKNYHFTLGFSYAFDRSFIGEQVPGIPEDDKTRTVISLLYAY